eukprot:gb/GECG01004878.1/.p1 GENE.gb/GECG01004878.1/~~gb/GECG01004878.1/.p1  ORF type:complete len:509 (+),score=62.83 gb/GECG01004878.1/:1-1527(+)
MRNSPHGNSAPPTLEGNQNRSSPTATLGFLQHQVTRAKSQEDVTTLAARKEAHFIPFDITENNGQTAIHHKRHNCIATSRAKPGETTLKRVAVRACSNFRDSLSHTVKQASEKDRIALLLEHCFISIQSADVVRTLWNNLGQTCPDLGPVNFLVIGSLLDDKTLWNQTLERLRVQSKLSRREEEDEHIVTDRVQLDKSSMEPVHLTPCQMNHLGIAFRDPNLIRNHISGHKACCGHISPRVGNGESLLHLAARADSIDCLELLLDEGLDVDIPREGDGRTPLMVAAEYNCAMVAWTLVKKGGASLCKVDATSDGMTSLYIACSWGSIDVVEFMLVCCGDEIWNTPLLLAHFRKGMMAACQNGDHELVRYMAEKATQQQQTVNFLEENSGLSPLMMACKHGHHKAARYLVREGGAAVNERARNPTQYTPLMLACHWGHFEVVQYLIEGTCAEVEMQSSEDDGNRKPHDIAISNGYDWIAGYLEHVGGAKDERENACGAEHYSSSCTTVI